MPTGLCADLEVVSVAKPKHYDDRKVMIQGTNEYSFASRSLTATGGVAVTLEDEPGRIMYSPGAIGKKALVVIDTEMVLGHDNKQYPTFSQPGMRLRKHCSLADFDILNTAVEEEQGETGKMALDEQRRLRDSHYGV